MPYRIVAHQDGEVFAIVPESAVRADGSIDMTARARVVHSDGMVSEPLSSLDSLIARGYWEDYIGPQGILNVPQDISFDPPSQKRPGFDRERRSL